MFRRVCLGIVALTVVAWLAVPASAEVIYFDGFSRPQSGLQHLSGTAPEVRSGTLGGSSTATWLAYAGPDYAGAPVEWDHSWQTDGTQAKMAWEGDPVQRMAWLPFVPQSGQVYTYSMRMNNTWAGSNNWIGMGFFKDVSDTQTPYFTYAAGPQIFERPMGATASEYSWSAAGPTGNGNSDNMAWGVKGQHEFEIILDTTGAQWSTSFAVDGGATYSRSYTYTVGEGNPVITHIGMGNGGGRMLVDNFTLTGVPEPSTLALLAGGLLGLLAYAWRKRR